MNRRNEPQANEEQYRLEDERACRVVTQWVAGFQVQLIKVAGMSDEKALEVARAWFAHHRDIIDPKYAANGVWNKMRVAGGQ